MSEIKLSELTFQAIVEASPSAILLVNKVGRIVYVNTLAEKLFEYERNELIGQLIEILIPDRFKAKHPHCREEFVKSPVSRPMGGNRDLFAIKKSKKEFPVEIGLNPLVTADETLILTSIIDITERKKMESIVKEQMLQLESKNHELERFNYIASHDLQEPLRTILNFTQIIEEDFSGKIDDEVFSYLYPIRDSAQRMQVLVRSLLDFSRLGRNSTVSEVNCNNLLKEVMADLNSIINENNVKITSDTLPVLKVYEVEFRQLFQNLINNAIKFSKKEVRPEISIGCSDHGAYVEFYVSDNGIGIEQKDFDKIFWIFHRLNIDEKSEGYGIGLANCKKIVEMHGGKIWVESKLDAGSIFKFTIQKQK